MERVWHYNSAGVFSAPKVHGNGHVRPDSVTFGTKLAAAKAWHNSIVAEIGKCTRILKTQRTYEGRSECENARNDLRKLEKRAIALISELEAA